MAAPVITSGFGYLDVDGADRPGSGAFGVRTGEGLAAGANAKVAGMVHSVTAAVVGDANRWLFVPVTGAVSRGNR